MLKLLLCQKCNNYLHPDYDGSDGCESPKVIDIFGNFHRKKKCKYYQKIKREKMLKLVKYILGRINSLLFYYRDNPDTRLLRKMTKSRINAIKWRRQDYLTYLNYLLELKNHD